MAGFSDVGANVNCAGKCQGWREEQTENDEYHPDLFHQFPAACVRMKKNRLIMALGYWEFNGYLGVNTGKAGNLGRNEGACTMRVAFKYFLV
jgi:hypothetical protein